VAILAFKAKIAEMTALMATTTPAATTGAATLANGLECTRMANLPCPTFAAQGCHHLHRLQEEWTRRQGWLVQHRE
jgi:hypothetical protein